MLLVLLFKIFRGNFSELFPTLPKIAKPYRISPYLSGCCRYLYETVGDVEGGRHAARHQEGFGPSPPYPPWRHGSSKKARTLSCRELAVRALVDHL